MLYIVHLSDFHFYNHSNWNNMKSCLIRKLEERTGLKTEGKTLLVITGDFHNFGDKEYKDAKELIVQLGQAMNLDISQDIFVVPGNHDKTYSDDNRDRKNQTNAIKATQKDIRELQDEDMIDLLLEPFSLYNDLCKEMKIYTDEETIPAGVHVRTWRNRLNVLHLNTALVADGRIKEDQVIDIKTLTNTSFRNAIPKDYPAIAIGHNDFYDLHDRIQVEATPVFSDKNVRAYLCGDKHRFVKDRIKMHIALSKKFSGRMIPNIVCGRCTTDEDDNFSDFGFYIHCWDEETGKVDLERYTWDDKNEQDDFTLTTEEGAYELSVQRLDIETEDLQRLKTSKLFEDKIRELSGKDGMMRCLARSFQEKITNNEFSTSELEILYIIQDEYKKVYDQYYIDKNVTNTEGLDRILTNKIVNSMENNSHTNSLIITYLRFIRADRKYFVEDFDGAIQDYREALDKIYTQYRNNEMPVIDKEKCAYLLNSIAWSYRRRYQEGDISRAIEWYNKLFSEYEDIDKYTFSWKYRRNYGVCHEIIGEFIPAIEQYKRVIKNYSEATDNGDMHEYKIFLTYSSAMMKYWDSLTQKTSGRWIENVRELYKSKNEFLNDDEFINIDAYLTHANEKYKKIDSKNALPDYYNQFSKMLTYKMILNSENSVAKKDIEEIKKKLKILESVNAKATGQHYVKRDFYYALYEIVSDKETKEDSYQKAWNENELIGNRGDANAFREMLIKKKDEDKSEENR